MKPKTTRYEDARWEDFAGDAGKREGPAFDAELAYVTGAITPEQYAEQAQLAADKPVQLAQVEPYRRTERGRAEVVRGYVERRPEGWIPEADWLKGERIWEQRGEAAWRAHEHADVDADQDQQAGGNAAFDNLVRQIKTEAAGAGVEPHVSQTLTDAAELLRSGNLVAARGRLRTAAAISNRPFNRLAYNPDASKRYAALAKSITAAARRAGVRTPRPAPQQVDTQTAYRSIGEWRERAVRASSRGSRFIEVDHLGRAMLALQDHRYADAADQMDEASAAADEFPQVSARYKNMAEQLRKSFKAADTELVQNRAAAVKFAKQAKDAVLKALGAYRSYWNGTVRPFPDQDFPGILAAVLPITGQMIMQQTNAQLVREAMQNPRAVIESPRALQVPLHELIHTAVQRGFNAAADEANYRQLRDIEEGFTELGTTFHAAEIFTAMGIGDRPTAVLASPGEFDPGSQAGMKARVQLRALLVASQKFLADNHDALAPRMKTAIDAVDSSDVNKALWVVGDLVSQAVLRESYDNLIQLAKDMHRVLNDSLRQNNPEYDRKKDSLVDALDIEYDKLTSDDNPSLSQAAWQINHAAVSVNEDNLSEAMGAIQWLQHTGRKGDYEDAMRLERQLRDLMDTPMAAHATLAQYAARLADPDRILAGNAWGTYQWQTAAAFRWSELVAESRSSRPNASLRELLPEIIKASDEINRTGTDLKDGVMAQQAAEAAARQMGHPELIGSNRKVMQDMSFAALNSISEDNWSNGDSAAPVFDAAVGAALRAAGQFAGNTERQVRPRESGQVPWPTAPMADAEPPYGIPVLADMKFPKGRVLAVEEQWPGVSMPTRLRGHVVNTGRSLRVSVKKRGQTIVIADIPYSAVAEISDPAVRGLAGVLYEREHGLVKIMGDTGLRNPHPAAS